MRAARPKRNGKLQKLEEISNGAGIKNYSPIPLFGMRRAVALIPVPDSCANGSVSSMVTLDKSVVVWRIFVFRALTPVSLTGQNFDLGPCPMDDPQSEKILLLASVERKANKRLCLTCPLALNTNFAQSKKQQKDAAPRPLLSTQFNRSTERLVDSREQFVDLW